MKELLARAGREITPMIYPPPTPPFYKVLAEVGGGKRIALGKIQKAQSRTPRGQIILKRASRVET
jgi:hypothetical protein